MVQETVSEFKQLEAFDPTFILFPRLSQLKQVPKEAQVQESDPEFTVY